MTETTAADRRRRLGLMVGALGVVYGDIGTSPLYALRECFHTTHGLPVEPGNVFGVISLIVWSLILMVSVKYLGLVMRADNKGEGGILALLSLATPAEGGGGRKRTVILLLGLFGAALLYGDGMLTPAVTVLGAMEGLEVHNPAFKPYVVPLSILVLVALFSVQRFGTGRVGSMFGPVMLLWFAVLAALGVKGIVEAPGILRALSPHYGALFLIEHGRVAFVVLGAVFLAVTGAEALYADMGHFGLKPIRRVWGVVVLPGLLLNYLGEGALLLVNPAAARNPFFMLAPSSPWANVPLVILATLAAVIASQALISGAFSLTMQAIQMGYLPRLIIRHTSHSERGQIFMPQVNGLLMLACIGLVLGFQSSSRLAGAYGIAVSMTMLATTLLFHQASQRRWGWSRGRATLVCLGFLVIELAFVAANSLKIWQGGWFPLLVGGLVLTLLTTWKKGRQVLRARLGQSYLPMEDFLRDLDGSSIHRVPGTAVFLSGNPSGTPIALLHNIKHNRVLHERVVVLTLTTEDVPLVPPEDRLHIRQLREGIHGVTARFGFMEQPNVPALLKACELQGVKINLGTTTYFLSRETILTEKGAGMARWRRNLFAAMSRNAQSATTFFRLPPNRVVELGMQVQL